MFELVSAVPSAVIESIWRQFTRIPLVVNTHFIRLLPTPRYLTESCSTSS